MERDNNLSSCSHVRQGNCPCGSAVTVQDVVPHFIAVSPVADEADEQEGQGADEVHHGERLGDHVARSRRSHRCLHSCPLSAS